jgi:hypothetical protein
MPGETLSPGRFSPDAGAPGNRQRIAGGRTHVNEQNEHTRSTAPSAPAGRGEPTEARRAFRRVLRRAAGLGIALLAVPVAVTLAVSGCGGDDADKTATNAEQEQHVVQGAATTPATPAVTAGQPGGPDPSGVGLLSTSEAPSPDLSASVQDTTVQPGHSVEVMAIATDDVRQVVLWDGVHDRQAFAYDSTAAAWRATYRMPLKAERVALSVTAFNGRDRWRRVWVFVATPKAERVGVPETEEQH